MHQSQISLISCGVNNSRHGVLRHPPPAGTKQAWEAAAKDRMAVLYVENTPRGVKTNRRRHMIPDRRGKGWAVVSSNQYVEAAPHPQAGGGTTLAQEVARQA